MEDMEQARIACKHPTLWFVSYLTKITTHSEHIFFPGAESVKKKRMQQQWHLFPAVSSKCEYDETSVNKSDGNGYLLKVCSCLLSLRSLRSSLVVSYCKGFAGFCALFGKVGRYKVLCFKMDASDRGESCNLHSRSLCLRSSTWSSWASHSTRCSITRPSWNRTPVAWTTSSKSARIPPTAAVQK